MNQMGSDFQKAAPFMERFKNERETVLFQVPDAAVNQLCGFARGAGREIPLFKKNHGKAGLRGLVGQSGSVNTAADDGHVHPG